MTDNAANPSALRSRAVILCVVTTSVIATIELTLGWMFGLLSVFAEGLHTTADLADSLVALVLIALAARPPDACHPYGHGKYDSLAGIIEGLCVLASGGWAGAMALRVLLGIAEAAPQPAPIVLAAMVLASVAYWLVSGYVLQLAVRTGSPPVYAEGMHLRTHVYVTAGLLGGLVLTRVAQARGWSFANQIDPVVALLLGAALLVIGVRLIVGGYRQLVDSALPTSERERLAACLLEFRHEFVEVHAVRSRQSGTERHVDIHLVVAAETTVAAAHDLAHRIDRRLAEALPGLRLLVHVEPAVGPLWRDYAARGWRGVVMLDDAGGAREATHHADGADPAGPGGRGEAVL